ncbi:MAG: ImmA/IrrE family metallo-endopeptidase [Desulfuromonadales bacterium]|nr:ImmA/IrrE family metallo-endopeptidase [Desulfuromonadales bacterium]
MITKIIKNETDYEQALERIDALMDAAAGTPEGDELELLATLVELYEEQAHPVALPNPVDAIKFRMEQGGLKQKDLIPFIGSASKVSEVLSGRRSLSLAMIRKLHQGLGVPAEVLLQDSKSTAPELLAELDWSKFPIKEMRKRGWLEDSAEDAAETMLWSWAKSLGEEALQPAYLRQHVRSKGKEDVYALNAWRIRVLLLAAAQELPAYKKGTVTTEFVRDMVRFSYLENGPLLAKEFLAKNGIHFVTERHLPHTHLDGAAFKFPDGSPVVALTLRHDRQDNFWFTLCHELAHVALHFDGNEHDAFFDNLDQSESNDIEGEADRWATEALIPSDVWKAADLCTHPTTAKIRSFAEALRISPVIPAGRVRMETGNFRLFGKYVAGQKVRRFFEG